MVNASPTSRRFIFFRAVALLFFSVAAFAALVSPLALRQDAIPLEVGAVAPRDLQAPYTVEFESEILTENARQAAVLTVSPVYSTADTSIARQQITTLRDALIFISMVRVDAYATPEQKVSDLHSISSISLTNETIETILQLGDNQWDIVQQESLSVLEQTMRNNIREGDIANTQRGVPSRISLALNETQAKLVAELVQAFIVPNSLYSPELTESARIAASEAVEPVMQRFIAGETIVAGGEVISKADLEALQTVGLVEPEKQILEYVGAGVLTLVISLFLWLYFNYRRTAFIKDMRGLLLVGLIFIVFLLAARLTIPNHAIVPYLFPLPAFGLLIATLFGVDTGFVLIFVLTLFSVYDMPDPIGLAVYYLLPSFVSILVLGKARRFWSFVSAGLVISLTGAAILMAYWMPGAGADAAWTDFAILAAAAAINGIASASLTLLLQFFVAQSMGLTTALQLLEYSRPDAVLLQFLLRSAPGTYQHSLQVANLAERAAESIGADSLLVRVGALYHDVGKANNPLFFIENQTPGKLDTHDDLEPEESSALIIRHVTDGVELAKKHRLPDRIIDFIREHHGTNITRYQYMQAVIDADGDATKVDEEKFRYPGPAPRSRETAILMFADGTEAITRAKRPQKEDELLEIVQKVIEVSQQNGQLDQTQLTLRDLKLITDSFVATLRGTLHPRVEYPSSSASKNKTEKIKEDDSHPTQEHIRR
jgi:putative nucleotidyltransferase with HDIG domain